MAETIYDALRESHQRQRTLCLKLVRSRPDAAYRADVFQQLRLELGAHAAAEERFLYAPMLIDDIGLDPSRHALAEHHTIDELIEELAEADFQSGQWLAKARKLSEKVRHHLKEEETKFFQTSGKILTDSQKTRLAQRYRKDFVRMVGVLGGR